MSSKNWYGLKSVMQPVYFQVEALISHVYEITMPG